MIWTGIFIAALAILVIVVLFIVFACINLDFSPLTRFIDKAYLVWYSMMYLGQLVFAISTLYVVLYLIFK